eukprot:2687028-Pyramimonas_sp.AAC.1
MAPEDSSGSPRPPPSPPKGLTNSFPGPTIIPQGHRRSLQDSKGLHRTGTDSSGSPRLLLGSHQGSLGFARIPQDPSGFHRMPPESQGFLRIPQEPVGPQRGSSGFLRISYESPAVRTGGARLGVKPGEKPTLEDRLG